MSTWPLLRGQVVQADIRLSEPKLFVVVSNNKRNQKLQSVLGVRLTTSPKPDIPSIVQLSGDDPSFSGRVMCDDITELFEDEILKVCGALRPATLVAVGEGLRAALAL